MKLLRGFWFAPLVAGALMGMSFPPLDQGWLMPIAWAVLFTSMRLRRGHRAGMQVFVASLVHIVPALWWMGALVGPLWIVVSLWCAGWEGLWGRFLAGRLLARGDRPHRAWLVLVPASHLVADMARTLVLTGFPWLLTGYSGWKNPVLLGGADLIGVHGATVAILMLAAGLTEFTCRRTSGEARAARALYPAAVIWAAFAAWGFVKPALIERAGPTVLLLQPNIPQFLKEDGRSPQSNQAIWKAHEDVASQAFAAVRPGDPRIELVVWAETMLPALAIRPLSAGAPLYTYKRVGEDEYIGARDDGLRVAAAARGTQTLAGVVSRAEDGRSHRDFNTVVLLASDGRILGHQDKQHLTPGGEYIPLRFLIPWREEFEAYLEDMIGFLPALQPGETGTVMPLPGGARAGVLICYESVFPEIPRQMVRDGATVLVNCSNYGWFAGTAEMKQALAMCAFRAAELHRAVVLSSNNGISAVVGPQGAVRSSTRADEAGYLVASVPLCDSSSPFLFAGEWAAWAIGTLAAVTSLGLSRSRPPEERKPAAPTGGSG